MWRGGTVLGSPRRAILLLWFPVPSQVEFGSSERLFPYYLAASQTHFTFYSFCKFLLGFSSAPSQQVEKTMTRLGLPLLCTQSSLSSAKSSPPNSHGCPLAEASGQAQLPQSWRSRSPSPPVVSKIMFLQRCSHLNTWNCYLIWQKALGK